MSMRHAILGLLSSGSKHGYDLRAAFERDIFPHGKLNIGQVYTTLDRLERDGQVRRQHRLDVAGYKGNGTALFKPDAQDLIWQTSGGIPRKINILCDNALLMGYRERQSKIDTSMIQKTINSLKWKPEIKSQPETQS